VLQGLWIGAAIVLPGISGGTAALILGIYEEFIDAIRAFRWRGVLPMVLGIGGGVLGAARVVGWLLNAVPTVLAAFLMGLVLVSAAYVLRQAGPGPSRLAGVVAGAVVALAAALGAPASPAGAANPSLPALFLGGMLAASVMLVPGLSGGTLLIALGLYEPVVDALNSLDLPMVLTFGAGALAGLKGLSHLVGFLIRRAHDLTLAVLAGLMLGSLAVLWPERVGLSEAAAFALAAGLVVLVRRGAGRSR